MPGKYKSGVRVIGGRWKGTKIIAPSAAGLRPTSGRIRETLFNWLQPHITGAKCLDLFAGSGALSLEALSRGASHALAVDCQLRSVEAMSSVCNRLKACGLEVRRDRAENFLERPHEDVFDIVFVDPPFDLGIQQSICAKLQKFRWLSPDALIYVEKAGKNGFICPPGWLELKRKHTGNVTYMLFQVPGS